MARRTHRRRRPSRSQAWTWYSAVDLPQPDGSPVNTWLQVLHLPAGNASGAQPAAYRKTGLGGVPSLEFDGTDDEYGLPGYPDTSHTLIAVVDPDAITGTLRYVADASSGRLIFAFLTNVSGQMGWYDGTWRSVGAAIAGPQILEWVLDGAVGTGSLYRNGELVGTAPYTPRAFEGTVRIGGNATGGGNNFDGDIGDVIPYRRLLSDFERRDIRHFMASRYPITL